MPSPGPSHYGRALLAIAGALSALLYGFVTFGQDFSNSPRDVTGFLAIFAVLFLVYALAAIAVHRSARSGSERPVLVVVFAFAILFRGILLFAGLPHERPLEALARDLTGRATGYAPFLVYDNDIWRYLWDGHLAANGVSPWAHTPREVLELAEAGQEPFAGLLASELWHDVLDNTSFQRHTTVYPPVAQLLFALSHRMAPGSVAMLKLLLALADLGTCVLLALLLREIGRRPSEALLYAWNPLVLKELAASGHIDALMIFLLTLALLLLVRGRQLPALVAYGASVLAKLGSGALAGLFLRHTRPRLWPALAVVLAVGLIPVRGDAARAVEGLAVFASDWVFNPGPWALVRAVAELAGSEDPAGWARLVTRVLTLLVVFAVPWIAARGQGPGVPAPQRVLRTAFLVMATVILLQPAVMPWYLLWALPLAVLAGSRSWLALTALSLLSYLIYLDGTEHTWWLWLEYGLFATALAAETRALRKR